MRQGELRKVAWFWIRNVPLIYILFLNNRADAKANAAMMEPPPPRPIIDMGRGMEPHMENGKLPYAAHQENYHQQQVHKVYL